MVVIKVEGFEVVTRSTEVHDLQLVYINDQVAILLLFRKFLSSLLTSKYNVIDKDLTIYYHIWVLTALRVFSVTSINSLNKT